MCEVCTDLFAFNFVGARSQRHTPWQSANCSITSSAWGSCERPCEQTLSTSAQIAGFSGSCERANYPEYEDGAGRDGEHGYFLARADKLEPSDRVALICAQLTADVALLGKPLEPRFGASDPFTLGIEEEYMLLDRTSLDLVQHIESVLAAAKGSDLEGQITGELM